MIEQAEALADGIEAALPRWVEASVTRIMIAWAGSVPDDIKTATADAGRRARQDVGPHVRALVLADIDDQATTPLAILRSEAVRYPTEVLRAAGVPPVERDRFVERVLPQDIYNLAPASFSDVDPGLQEVGLAWGAAKAFEHKRRHRT